MTHGQIIDQLGGYRALATRLGRHPSSAFRWRALGIPPKLWLEVVEVANVMGVFLSVEGVARSAPTKHVL